MAASERLDHVVVKLGLLEGKIMILYGHKKELVRAPAIDHMVSERKAPLSQEGCEQARLHHAG